MYKNLLNASIQLLAIFFLAKYFVYDNTSEDKLALILSPYILYLVLFLFFTKFFISYLFYLLVNLISGKKNKFLIISETFLYGGIINQMLPGIGHIYKYYKLRFNSKISLAEYSFSQTILSLKSLFAYLFFAIIGGIIYISDINTNYLFLLIFFLFIILITYNYSGVLKDFFKKKLLKIKKLNNLLTELKKIKDNLKYNQLKILLIFIGFILLALSECFAFFIALKLFGADISLVSASYIWIISVLARAVILLNYIGIFELILLNVAAIISPDLNNMIIFGISFRIINTSGLILAALSSSILILFYKK